MPRRCESSRPSSVLPPLPSDDFVCFVLAASEDTTPKSTLTLPFFLSLDRSPSRPSSQLSVPTSLTSPPSRLPPEQEELPTQPTQDTLQPHQLTRTLKAKPTPDQALPPRTTLLPLINSHPNALLSSSPCSPSSSSFPTLRIPTQPRTPLDSFDEPLQQDTLRSR